MEKYDFSGWATRNNVRCSDGRTIMKDAFKHCDGQKVPLVWAHQHDKPENTLGHAILENREEGVYAYCSFNDTTNGELAKTLVKHGDITALSIFANQLKQDSSKRVMHGYIREVSLVHAGANPEAFIENVIVHSEDGEFLREVEDEVTIYTGEEISLYHAEEAQASEETEQLKHKEEAPVAEETKKEETTETTETESNKAEVEHSEKTVKEVWDDIEKKLDKTEMDVVYAMIGAAAGDEAETENNKEEVKHSEGGNTEMKHNVFEAEANNVNTLSHADQETILKTARMTGVGSFQTALSMYLEDNKETLAHGIDDIETLFPDYKDVKPGAPELIERDQTWVGQVMSKTHKSPISRIRTRQADARGADLRAKGYGKKGNLKKESGNIKLMGRTTDPQTVYRKDSLHRDDIIDITDFDVVAYQYGIMKRNLYEDIALATMVGDLRDDGDADKISEEHIRPIWKDDELYTIHYDVDIEAAKEALQGSDTSVHFGDNYIYAEAIITAALYSREQYKGSGNLEFYCTPHLLNVMLLARDLNGRRIYDSKADLAKALNVTAIHTAEQFEGLTRTDAEGNEKELLGLFVNLNDYQHGSTKGGEITKFEQFDIDFNLNKYLIETRLSGALVRIKSAIALEMPIA